MHRRYPRQARPDPHRAHAGLGQDGSGRLGCRGESPRTRCSAVQDLQKVPCDYLKLDPSAEYNRPDHIFCIPTGTDKTDKTHDAPVSTGPQSSKISLIRH
jgi:hypothetical protein